MAELLIPDITMEVMTATAEYGGIDVADLPAVLEHGGPDNLAFMSRRSAQILAFRDGILCEGSVGPDSIAVGPVTKGLIELDHDVDEVPKQREDVERLVSQCLAKGLRFSGRLELDPLLSPKILLLNTLIPNHHRIIELGQIAADMPQLRGIDSYLRFESFLAFHPTTLRKQP